MFAPFPMTDNHNIEFVMNLFPMFNMPQICRYTLNNGKIDMKISIPISKMTPPDIVQAHLSPFIHLEIGRKINRLCSVHTFEYSQIGSTMFSKADFMLTELRILSRCIKIATMTREISIMRAPR